MANVQECHWKLALSWESGMFPTFRYSLEAWLYAPHPDDSGFMLRARHAAYPGEVRQICEQFKKELQRLRREFAKAKVREVYVDIERRDVARFRYVDGERYKLTEEGIALYSFGTVQRLYSPKEFFELFQRKLEDIARQFQDACWELAVRKEEVSA